MKRRSFLGLLAAPFVARLFPELLDQGEPGFLVPEDYAAELLAVEPMFHPFRTMGIDVSPGLLEDIRHFQRKEITELFRVPPSLLEFDWDDDDQIALTSDPPLPLK